MLAMLGCLVGAVLLMIALIFSVWLGDYSSADFLRLPDSPLSVNAQEPPTIELFGKLLEIHGNLRSEDELQIAEYGISIPATCLLAEARVVSTDPHGNFINVLTPLNAAKREQLNCPDCWICAEHLYCGHYPIAQDFIPSLLRDRGLAGYTCMRSILPLPVEHIHLPEHLQSMARVLPETQRLDKPDCTIIHLAERYRDPTVPTGPAQPGDVELRFSYLPAEFPVSLRGKMGEFYLTANSATTCAFAAGNKQLPPVKTSYTSYIGLMISCFMFLLAAGFIFLLILAGFWLLIFGLSCLRRCHYHISPGLRLITALSLEAIALAIGLL